MKKLLSLILAAAMALSLVACSSDEAETTTTTEGTEGDAPLKVLLIVSQLGDKSFNDSANVGLLKAEEELGIDYEVLEITNDINKVEPSLTEAAETGYDMITFNNMGFGKAGEWLEANAELFPETTFVIYDEAIVDFPQENIVNVCFRANESDFLAGALAAKLSETGTIAFIGGINNPVIADFLVGYIQGATYVNPEIELVLSYTEDWTDITKGKELGVSAIEQQGADVVHAVAGSSGNGALEAAMEAGVYGIGVDSDQYELFKEANPELAATIVTSSLKTVGDALYNQVENIQAGTVPGGERVWYGINEGGAGLAKNENYLAVVPAEIQAEMDEIEAKVASGEIEVDSYFGMSDEDYEALKATVIG